MQYILLNSKGKKIYAGSLSKRKKERKKKRSVSWYNPTLSN